MITETVLAIAGLNALTTTMAAPALLLPRLYAEALKRFAETLQEDAERSPQPAPMQQPAQHQARRRTRPAPVETHRAAA